MPQLIFRDNKALCLFNKKKKNAVRQIGEVYLTAPRPKLRYRRGKKATAALNICYRPISMQRTQQAPPRRVRITVFQSVHGRNGERAYSKPVCLAFLKSLLRGNERYVTESRKISASGNLMMQFGAIFTHCSIPTLFMTRH